MTARSLRLRPLALAATALLAACCSCAAQGPMSVRTADGSGVSIDILHTKSSSKGSRTIKLPPGIKSPMKVLQGEPLKPSAAAAAAGDEPPVQQGAADGSGDVVFVSPSASGAAGLSYTDSRFGMRGEYFINKQKYIGLLTFQIDGGTYQCTATLVGKSLLLTAAHCTTEFGNGTSGFYTDHTFYPRYNGSLFGGTAPYGSWKGRRALVPATYVNGTDTCLKGAEGVVCNNDLALIELLPGGFPHEQKKPSWKTEGYANYGFNFYSAVASDPSYWVSIPKHAHVTQFGYPGNYDWGLLMQLSSGYAFEYILSDGTQTSNGKVLKQIVKGSSLRGGSSGGPWIVNYGNGAEVTGGDTYGYGSFTTRNVIVGVTSWGYTDNSMQQGVSFFGQNAEYPNAAYGKRGGGNIGYLMWQACDVLWRVDGGNCR